MEETEQTLNFADSSNQKKKKKGSTSTGTNPLEVTIDFSLCEKYHINPGALIYILCVRNTEVEKRHEVFKYFYSDWNNYSITLGLSGKKIEDVEQAIWGEVYRENCFDELLAAFPKETPDGRKLRTDTDKARKAYDKITKKSSSAHEHIMSCLQTEIKERNKTGQMKYMSNIYSWINRKLWTVYEYQTEEEKRKEEFNFSQDVL